MQTDRSKCSLAPSPGPSYDGPGWPGLPGLARGWMTQMFSSEVQGERAVDALLAAPSSGQPGGQTPAPAWTQRTKSELSAPPGPTLQLSALSGCRSCSGAEERERAHAWSTGGFIKSLNPRTVFCSLQYKVVYNLGWFLNFTSIKPIFTFAGQLCKCKDEDWDWERKGRV